jgi:hypothetical protein
VADLKPPLRDEYGEPVDSLQPSKTPEEVLANPIYEGIYSEPLYGIAGTILVGPQVKLTYILAFLLFTIIICMVVIAYMWISVNVTRLVMVVDLHLN